MNKANDGLLPARTTGRHRYTRLAYIAIEFIVLFGFWLILSGHYQTKYFVMGALSAGLVTFLTNDLIYPSVRFDSGQDGRVSVVFLHWRHFLAYIPWLLYSIVKANLEVARLVLNPRLPIDPALLQFQTGLKRRISQVTLANSITLTPGTVTIDLKEGKYLVHALAPALAGGLISGKMQSKVANLFWEVKESSVTAKWAHSTNELEEE